MRSRRRAVEMCEIVDTDDFQGLWEEGETGQSYRPVFHAFHQTVISTAFLEKSLNNNLKSLL